MRAVVFDRYGAADVLHLADIAQPHAQPGQIRIRVHAAAVNPVDWKIRSGASAAFHQTTFPHVPGLDAAGVVDEVGPGVDGTRVGDEVFGSTLTGASAQYALLDPTATAPRPPVMSWFEAAGLPSVAETGLRAVDLLGVTAGQTVLISGVAGGVGLAAAQFAASRGATVLGTASVAHHVEVARLGIMPIAYGDDLPQRIRAAVPVVDRAVDAAGHDVLPDLIALTGSPENVITVADGVGAQKHGVRFTTGAERRYWEALQLATALYEKGAFTLPVRQVYPVAQAAEAHRHSETGHGFGKLILAMD